MLKIHLFLKTYSFYRCLELCSNSFLVLQPGLAVFASRPGNNCVQKYKSKDVLLKNIKNGLKNVKKWGWTIIALNDLILQK